MTEFVERPDDELLLEEGIRSLGSLLDDLEQARIANGNRIGALVDRYGEPFPQLAALQHGLEGPGIVDLEARAEEMLLGLWARHPLAAWQEGMPNLGAKLAARLVATTGDPALRGLGHWEQSPRPDNKKRRLWVIDGYVLRSASQLAAFCGHGDPSRAHPPRGASQEELFRRGSPRAKTRAWLIGASFVKATGKRGARSPYRDLYEAERARYAGKLHEVECVRCGPAGHPARPGSPWGKGHQDGAAVRNITKAFLFDLWCEARRLHGLPFTPRSRATGFPA